MDMILPESYHPTEIIQYMICPKQFELNRRFPKKGTAVMIMGTIAHKMIEDWHRGALVPRCETDVMTAFINATGRELSGLADNDGLSKKNETRLIEIPTMLWGYMIANGVNRDDGVVVPKVGTNPTVRALEERFVFEFAGLKFEGMIDQIRRRDNGECILVDIKTGENAPSQVMLDLSYQYSVYAYAMGNAKFESGNTYDYPAEIWQWQVRDYVPLKRGPKKGEDRGPAVYKTYRTPGQLEEVMGDIVKICTQIMLQIFPRHPSWACTMCRYQEMCLEFAGDEPGIDMMEGVSDDGNIW